MSKLAIGTWYMGDSIENEDQEIQAIRYAIDNGVNIIDTAQMYGDGNSERLVAKAIKPYKREDIFLVSKVLPQNSTRDKIFKACQQSLDRLEVDYLDLYLLHWREDNDISETFECMEELKKMDKIKNWGVSNFDIDDMKDIEKLGYIDKCYTNQVLYHLGSRGIEYSLKPYMDSKNIVLMAYCPLARAGELKKSLLESDCVKTLAKKYNITPIQVLLVFVLLQDNTIAVAKSSKVEHMKQNIDCLNIKFDKCDLDLLDKYFQSPKFKVELDYE